MYTYQYIGNDPITLPELSLGPEEPGGPQSDLVMPSQIIQSNDSINRDDFVSL